MAQQTINIGASPNDGTGTPLRTAFQYTNSNFSELYTAVGPSGNNIVCPGSATITGDLTVDTSTLKVDSANNRVGIVNASPTRALDVVGSAIVSSEIRCSSLDTGTTSGDLYLFTSNRLSQTAAPTIECQNSSKPLIINHTGSQSMLFGIGSSLQMTLNATGLGVGVTPSAWASGNKFIDINSSAAFGAFGSSDAMMIGNAYWNGSSWIRKTANNAWRFVIESVSSTPTMTWQLAANGSAGSSITWTQAMTLDASGNLGIGVTPSAWSAFKSIDIGTGSSISGASTTTALGFNNYWNGSNYIYKLTAAAGDYRQTAFGHAWFTAPSGTAGTAITWTQAMTLDASGRLILLASTTTPATLSANGQLTFTATSDTNLRFSYRGSDGVTRTADLTLA